jgi:hypothetical protein
MFGGQGTLEVWPAVERCIQSRTSKEFLRAKAREQIPALRNNSDPAADQGNDP